MRLHRVARPQQLVVALGLLWILDALLQLQPNQFRPDFATSLQMNAMAQPTPIAALTLGFGRLIAPHVAWWNVGIAGTQLLLGLAILWPRSRRLGLFLEVGWAAGIWVFGEGLGNVATGFAMLPNGAPGAALLYCLLGVVLLRYERGVGSAGSDSPQAEQRAQREFVALWRLVLVVGIALQAVSPFSSAFRLRADLNELVAGEPGWLAAIDRSASAFGVNHAAVLSAVIICLEIAALLAPSLPTRRGTLGIILIVLGLAWMFGENFGGLLSGTANDPGEMPLLGLIAFGALSRTPRYLPDIVPASPRTTLLSRRPIGSLAP